MERELIGWEFDELLPHIEDDLRTGAFEMEKSGYRCAKCSKRALHRRQLTKWGNQYWCEHCVQDHIASFKKEQVASQPEKAQSGFHVGDTVKVTAEDLDGQQGELRVIDPEASEGEFFGVYLDSTQTIVYFCADEIEKVR